MTALYVKIDDSIRTPRRRGQPLLLTDSELVCHSLAPFLYAYGDGYGSRDQRAFTAVGALLGRGVLPPGARKALYAAVAKIPGVTVDRAVRDPAGRPGVGVGRTEGGIRHELVFDPVTYEFAGWQLRTVSDDRVQPSNLRRQVVARVAVVDSAGQLPPG